MRVAALYDVHGNLPALAAVLEEVDALAVDTIVVGGDVSSGPMPVESLDELRARNARFIRGNADRVLDLRGATDDEMWVRARQWVAARLGEERLSFLAVLPLDLSLELPKLGRVRFCHGAPGSDEITITRLTMSTSSSAGTPICSSSGSSTPSALSMQAASVRPTRQSRAPIGRCSATTSRYGARSTTSKPQPQRSRRPAIRGRPRR